MEIGQGDVGGLYFAAFYVQVKLIFPPIDSPHTCSVVVPQVVPSPSARDSLQIKPRVINYDVPRDFGDIVLGE